MMRLGSTGFSLYVFVSNTMGGRPTCPCEAGSFLVACLRRFSGALTGSSGRSIVPQWKEPRP
jgi:hypothetical protein